MDELHGGVKGFSQHFIGKRHGGRGKRGNPVGSIIFAHAAQARKVSVGEVRRNAAVAVDIHKARNDQGSVQVDSGLGRDEIQNLREAAVLHTQTAVDKMPGIGKDHCVFI